MTCQLINAYFVVLSVALHTQKPLQRKHTHLFCLCVIDRHKPRVFLELFQVVGGDMKLYVVTLSVAGGDNVYLVQVPQCFLQRVIKAGSCVFIEQISKSTTVELYNSGVHTAVEDVPAYAEYGLESHQADGIVGVSRRMSQLEGKISRDNCPHASSDFLSDREDTGWVCLPVAGIAESHTLALIIIMERNGVLVHLFGVSIEFPEPQNDVIKLYDMVAFEVFDGVAPHAHRCFVPRNPLAIRTGSPYSLLQNFCPAIVVHTAYYTQDDGICFIKTWDLRLHLRFRLNIPQEFEATELRFCKLGISRQPKTQCISIISSYIAHWLLASSGTVSVFRVIIFDNWATGRRLVSGREIFVRR